MRDIVERLRLANCLKKWRLERERCEAYKGQVEAGAAEIERLRRLEKTNDETIGPCMATFEQVRAATVEECAKEADQFAGGCRTGRAIAKRIRALKEQQK